MVSQLPKGSESYVAAVIDRDAGRGARCDCNIKQERRKGIRALAVDNEVSPGSEFSASGSSDDQRG